MHLNVLNNFYEKCAFLRETVNKGRHLTEEKKYSTDKIDASRSLFVSFFYGKNSQHSFRRIYIELSDSSSQVNWEMFFGFSFV